MITLRNHTPFQTAVILLTVCAGALTSLAGWTPRALMSTTSYSYQCTTATAIGPNGDAVAAWVDEPTGLAYAAVQRNSLWGASKPIYKIPVNAPEQIIDVRVAMGGDGTAIAAIVLSHFDRYGAYQVVMAATLAAGQSAWSPAVEVSARAATSSIWLGADADGNALLLWASAGSVLNASRPAGGAWSAPQRIPGCTRVDDFAMNGAGNAAVVWIDVTGTTYTLRAMKRSPGGTWSAPAEVAITDGPSYGAQVALDGQGLAAVAWLGGLSYQYDIWLTRESMPGAWEAPQAISDPAASASAMDVAMDTAGDLAVAWSELDAMSAEYRIHAQWRPAAGAVQDQAWLITDVGYGIVGAPRVGLSPDGSLATVAWIDDGVAQAFAATYTPAMRWSAPTLIGAGLYQNNVALACGPSATACAVWPTWSGIEFKIGFRASTYRLAYPLPVLTSITPSMARQGLAALDVLAIGRNFLLAPGATLLEWDGAALATSPVSSNAATGNLTATELAAEGIHQITVRNTAPGGGVSKALPVIVDGTAPATTAGLTGKLALNGWYTGAVQVKLTGTDALTGVGSIVYQVDALVPVTRTFALSTPLTTPKTTSFSVSGDGMHIVTYSSADNVGIADAGTQTIRIDTKVPVVTATATPRALPAADGAMAPVTVGGSITDATAGIDISSARFSVWDEYGACQPVGGVAVSATGAYTFTTSLDTHRDSADTTGRTYKLTVSAKDLAGLAKSTTVVVTVR